MTYKVLSINTYGGSLLIAAQMAGMEVVASLEDAGFGSDLQALNFPDVPIIQNRKDWKLLDQAELKWDEIITIAHPPCAAFSNQNQNASKRGTTTDAFKCHVDVMEFSLSRGTAALAIESVPGAFDAANTIYAEYAFKYKYNYYFILQNAVDFGVPQWRPRFWVWFLKKPSIILNLPAGNCTTLRSILDGHGTPAGPTARRSRLRPGMERALSQADSTWRGSLLSILEKREGLKREKNFANVRAMYGLEGLFTTCLPRFVDPDDFSCTVLEDSWWWYGNRELTREEYCAIMGFPRDYKWGKQVNHFRKYLSKGVCPPVAKWVLEMIQLNLNWDGKPIQGIKRVQAGNLTNFLPKRSVAVNRALKGRSLFGQ